MLIDGKRYIFKTRILIKGGAAMNLMMLYDHIVARNGKRTTNLFLSISLFGLATAFFVCAILPEEEITEKEIYYEYE